MYNCHPWGDNYSGGISWGDHSTGGISWGDNSTGDPNFFYTQSLTPIIKNIEKKNSTIF